MGRRGAGSIPATRRRDGATGIDGVTAADYEKDLEANLESLLDRIKSGGYRAPPVRRHYIPKADGTRRPLGIPTFEDKVAQRAILMMLEPIYETDFLPCSYGFRRGRSAHDALNELRKGIIEQRQRWVIDADISKYFDSITHSHLRSFLDLRIKDGVVRRMIDKWLKAGVLEEDALHRPVAGTPQGGVISPTLSNVYLHHVLDEWFEEVAKPRLHGRCQLVRFADDFVIAFEDRHSGKRMSRASVAVLSALPRPSRRSSRPTSPGCVQLSASSRIRSRYCAVNLRLFGLATTSGSGVGRAWLAPALGASSRRSSTPRAGAPISCNVIDSLSAVIGIHLHRPTVIPSGAGVSVRLAERERKAGCWKSARPV